MQFFILALKGIAIGIAQVIPGVSGATLAVIFKVYDRLIESINTIFSDMKKSLKFLIPLGIGMGVGILAVGTLLDYFLVNFSLQASALISGLMAGSIPFIHRLAVSKGEKKPYHYVVAVLAALVIILTSLFAPTPEIYTGAGLSVGLVIILFVAGFFGAAAMIIPGVSGAMVLMLLGVFSVIMYTINQVREYLMTPLDFGLLPPIIMVVAPVGIGMVVGILLTSRLIAKLLKNHHTITYFAILGMIFGTIFAVFNDDDTYKSHPEITFSLVVISLLVFAAGAIVSLKLGSRE